MELLKFLDYTRYIHSEVVNSNLLANFIIGFWRCRLWDGSMKRTIRKHRLQC
jgi:hypothetical protein